RPSTAGAGAARRRGAGPSGSFRSRVLRTRRRSNQTRSDLDHVVGFAEDRRGLLDRAAGPGEALLVHRQLVATRIDRLAEPCDRQIGELLGDRVQPLSYVVELT